MDSFGTAETLLITKASLDYGVLIEVPVDFITLADQPAELV